MAQYLDVPSTPSVILTQPSYKRTKASSFLNGFYTNSTSARGSRDTQSRKTYRGSDAKRSNSDYGLPHIYNNTFTTPSLRPSTPFSKIDTHRRYGKASPMESPGLYTTPNSRRTSCSTKTEENNAYYFTDFKVRMEKVPVLQILQIILAEVLGTTLLLFLGCAPFTTFMPWTFGFAIMLAVQAFGSISGAHINPAVTILAFIMGKLANPYLIPIYWISQMIGGMIGYAMHFYIVLPAFPGSDRVCITMMHPHVTPLQGVVLEIIVMFWFALSICAFWDPKCNHAHDTACLKFGLIVTGLIWSMEGIIPLSLNTARSFPPALLNLEFQDHWIYWVGPNVGSALAGCVYRFLLFPRPYLDENEET